MLIFAGDNIPITASIQSAFVELSSEDTTNIGKDMYVYGQTNISSLCFRRMLELLQSGVLPGSSVSSIAITF